MEYKINDIVMHKNHGICTIDSIVEMYGKEYYKLVLKSSNTTVYIPLDNTSSISNIMNKEEADKLLLYMKNIDDDCIDNSKQRREHYIKKMNSGDVKDLAYIAKSLYTLKKERTNKNLKFSAIDNELFNKVNNLLFDELSLAYNIDREDVLEFMLKRMEEL